MKYDVFISYRRDGGDTLSQLIYDRLTHKGYRVFLDIESLNSGKFNEKLLEVIEECKDMVIILPPKGLDRCHNEGDWLYRELEHGIKHQKNIVPVLMKNFEWPDNIPEKIAQIRNYNGIVDNKDYFDAVIDKLTTLLTSKPVVGGNALRRLGERSYAIKGQAKKKKRMLFGFLLIILVGIGAFAGIKCMENQRRLEEQTNAIIRITPSEEMSASEYYDAIEVLEERFEILADGQEYSFEEEKDEITVRIPESVFHDIDITKVMQCYVTRPTEIYLSYWNEESGKEDNYFHIDRSAIENIELVDEIPVEVDFENYEFLGVEREEECQFFSLTVNDETVKAAKEWIEKTEGNRYQLSQDVEYFDHDTYYYYLEGMFETDNTLYFADNYQYSNILNLVQHNYKNETFSQPFYFSIELPVVWEYDDGKEVVFGENQCNINELDTEKSARYYFETNEDEMTEGEYQDVYRGLKARFDTLGVPYAMGYQNSNINTIVIATDPAYMNNIFLEYAGTDSKIQIQSKFYNLLDEYYVEEIEVKEKEDGTYQLLVKPTEDWSEYEKENSFEQLQQDELIYLCISDYPAVPLDESTLAEAFDGEKFVFDSLTLFGVDSVGTEEKHFFDFLKTLQKTDMPFDYWIGSIQTEMEEEEMEAIIADATIEQELKAHLEETIAESEIVDEFEVAVEKMGQDVDIKIICPEEDYVEYVNKVFKDIYERCDMNTGDSAHITVYFYKGSVDREYTYFQLQNSYSSHDITFSAIYSYEETEDVMNMFDKIFNEDEFYKQFTVNDYYFNDGYISFKK